MEEWDPLIKNKKKLTCTKTFQFQITGGAKSSAGLNDRAMQHPLCANNATAYVGQTAKMYCCLARLDRELSVSNELPRAAGTCEDMRTGPHHVFSIEGKISKLYSS